MKDKIEKLEERLRGLERDLDELHKELESLRVSRQNMKDLMEEVAKLANQPVGLMFDYRA
tara:strand:+ start:908 stop:1087 length:180 start_codon:yes stop_codon:yes gene_type:complete